MKITVIGDGYVGLVTRTCFAEMEHDVMCIDINNEKINQLKKGIISIYEKGLENLVKKNQKAKKLSFNTDIKKGIEFADIVFSAVSTPNNKNYKTDLQFVKQVSKSFGQYINKPKIFVNKSTAPVGTGKICKKIIKQELKKRKVNYDFDVVSNPEFLREGSAIEDTLNPDRIIIGINNKKSAEILKKIYEPILKNKIPLIITSIESAELIKYASNAFLATKISFINEMANFCNLSNADINDVAKGIGLDKRIGEFFLNAGIGYGGSCLPKDIKALIQKGKESKYDFKLLKAVENINKNQNLFLFKKLKKLLTDLSQKTIAIWGLSFKPNTDDMRDAPAILLIKSLIKEKAKIKVYDPVAMEKAKKILTEKNIYFAKNSSDAIKNTDALLIVTEWDEFKNFDIKKFSKLMKGNIILDGRNIYKPKKFKNSKIKYFSIGQN
jgi:UDPglucose 6-dehydrogenase